MSTTSRSILTRVGNAAPLALLAALVCLEQRARRRRRHFRAKLAGVISCVQERREVEQPPGA
jgi:hypothetical protein